jgi:hypothetical protein
MPIPAERDMQKTRIVIKIGLLVEQSGRSVSSYTKNPLPWTLSSLANSACQFTYKWRALHTVQMTQYFRVHSQAQFPHVLGYI